MDTKNSLSTLWIFVLLNIIFRDLHEMLRPGVLLEMQSGIINGNPMSESFLLVAAIMIEIPISMVLFSKVLPYPINYRLNIGVAILLIIGSMTFGFNDMDDLFFLIVENIALATIIWKAWNWRTLSLLSLKN